jgi:hypothetical protein
MKNKWLIGTLWLSGSDKKRPLKLHLDRHHPLPADYRLAFRIEPQYTVCSLHKTKNRATQARSTES